MAKTPEKQQTYIPAAFADQKSILAKLIARENITVVHTNAETASFNPSSRVLVFPIYKDLNHSVYNMFAAHESAHALWTPRLEPTMLSKVLWSEKHKREIPFDLLNVVEDIRIEKNILKEFPGFGRDFREAFQTLFKDGFFGTTKKSLDTLNLVDRINLNAKAHGVMEAPVYDEERAIYDQCMGVKTWEDVCQAVKDLYDFVAENYTQPLTLTIHIKGEKALEEGEGESKNNAEATPKDKNDSEDAGEEEKAEKEESESGEDNDDAKEGEGDGEAGEGENANEKEKEEKPGGDKQGKSEKETGKKEGKTGAGDSNDREGAGLDTKPTKVSVKLSAKTLEESLQSKTQNALNQNMRKRAVKRQENTIVYGPSVETTKTSVAPWTLVQEARQKRIPYQGCNIAAFKDSFNAFRLARNEDVNRLFREFEMRKAAYRNARSTTADSGEIDMNKLVDYKFSDDLFLKSAILPDAKSHGIFMLVDYSWSMQSTIARVLEQTIVLSMFCRKAKIPFKVYGFTTGNTGRLSPTDRKKVDAGAVFVDVEGSNTFELLCSDMRKDDFEKVCGYLLNTFTSTGYISRRNGGHSPYARPTLTTYQIGASGTPKEKSLIRINDAAGSYESMGGTPLYNAAIILRNTMEEFVKRNKLQKMNLVLLTDGASGELEFGKNHRGYTRFDRQGTDKTTLKLGSGFFPIPKYGENGPGGQNVIFAAVAASLPCLVKVTHFFLTDTGAYHYLNDQAQEVSRGIVPGKTKVGSRVIRSTTQMVELAKEQYKRDGVAAYDDLNAKACGFDLKIIVRTEALKNAGQDFKPEKSTSQKEMIKDFDTAMHSKKIGTLIAQHFCKSFG